MVPITDAGFTTFHALTAAIEAATDAAVGHGMHERGHAGTEAWLEVYCDWDRVDDILADEFARRDALVELAA